MSALNGRKTVYMQLTEPGLKKKINKKPYFSPDFDQLLAFHQVLFYFSQLPA